MELNRQVVSLELARRLKELGMGQESYFWWNELSSIGDEAHWALHHFKMTTANENVSAFTVSELGEMLPHTAHGAYLMCCKSGDGSWSCQYGLEKSILECKTLAEAMGKMLAYLLENGLMSFDGGKA